jgi:hypothetical protein
MTGTQQSVRLSSSHRRIGTHQRNLLSPSVIPRLSRQKRLGTKLDGSTLREQDFSTMEAFAGRTLSVYWFLLIFWKWAVGLITNLQIEGMLGSSCGYSESTGMGLEGLHVQDHHYITCGNACILILLAAHKQAWLSGILIGQEMYLDSKAREMEVMWTCMLTG